MYELPTITEPSLLHRWQVKGTRAVFKMAGNSPVHWPYCNGLVLCYLEDFQNLTLTRSWEIGVTSIRAGKCPINGGDEQVKQLLKFNLKMPSKSSVWIPTHRSWVIKGTEYKRGGYDQSFIDWHCSDHLVMKSGRTKHPKNIYGFRKKNLVQCGWRAEC